MSPIVRISSTASSGNFDIEGFLEGHHQFDHVERICSKIIEDARVFRHFDAFDSELVSDDRLNPIGQIVCHGFSSLQKTAIKQPKPGKPKWIRSDADVVTALVTIGLEQLRLDITLAETRNDHHDQLTAAARARRVFDGRNHGGTR